MEGAPFRKLIERYPDSSAPTLDVGPRSDRSILIRAHTKAFADQIDALSRELAFLRGTGGVQAPVAPPEAGQSDAAQLGALDSARDRTIRDAFAVPADGGRDSPLDVALLFALLDASTRTAAAIDQRLASVP